ncbi:MAG TPA: acyl-CoA dehydrogenase [Longimicrobiales bacterium]|nr:acyl-CoA dehydrogenase [Longimicrobiales bacterium]
MHTLLEPRPVWWSDDVDLTIRTDAVRTRLRDLDLPNHHMSQDLIRGGAIRDLFRDLWDLDPFREYLPGSVGGAGGDAAELLAVLDTVAYEHLPLSLAVGITGALFILPVDGHAAPHVALDTLQRIAGDDVWLGGMMMTEPSCGSDLLNACSTAEPNGCSTRIRGMKHWSGLTGHADSWLVFARDDSASRSGRMGFYVATQPAVRDGFRVEEFYSAFGLAPIPYGRTSFDAEIPSENRLGDSLPYTRVMAGVLCGSRKIFAGMAHGLARRCLDEATRHTNERQAFGGSLSDLDQVQARLDDLRFSECLTRALCFRVIAMSERITSTDPKAGHAALLVKALGTELMAESAENLALLRGGEGYRRSVEGFSVLVDSYPYRVFEGPNDVLFEQYARGAIKAAGTDDVGELLREAGLQVRGGAVSALLGMCLTPTTQRDLVLLGHVLGVVELVASITGVDGADRFTESERSLVERVGEERIAAGLAKLAVRCG